MIRLCTEHDFLITSAVAHYSNASVCSSFNSYCPSQLYLDQRLLTINTPAFSHHKGCQRGCSAVVAVDVNLLPIVNHMLLNETRKFSPCD